MKEEDVREENIGADPEKPRMTKEKYKFYLLRASVIVIAAAAILIIYFCIARIDGLAAAFRVLGRILSPIFIAFVLAFLMNPIMKAFEKVMLPFFLKLSAKRATKKVARKTARLKKAGKETDEDYESIIVARLERDTRHGVRVFSSIITLLIVIAVVVVFLVIIIPQIVDSINSLIANLNTQVAGVVDWLDDITGHSFHDFLQTAKDDKNIENTLNIILTYFRDRLSIGEGDNMINTIASLGYTIGRLVLVWLIGIIASIYVLTEKEKLKSHTKKLIYGIFKTKHANVILDVGRKAKEIFYGFIVGKLIDSLIIGIICYLFLLLFGFPYPVLCAFTIGITNIIPVFGPYIGAIPTVLLVFMNNPVQGIYMLIFVIILQQIDGNIIGPAILGNSTGLSPFWVVFAIIIGGGLFGIPGMIIGVPVVALLYYIGSLIANALIVKKGLPTDGARYVNVKSVDPETKELIDKTRDEIDDSTGVKKIFRKGGFSRVVEWIDENRERRKQDRA